MATVMPGSSSGSTTPMPRHFLRRLRGEPIFAEEQLGPGFGRDRAELAPDGFRQYPASDGEVVLAIVDHLDVDSDCTSVRHGYESDVRGVREVELQPRRAAWAADGGLFARAGGLQQHIAGRAAQISGEYGVEKRVRT